VADEEEVAVGLRMAAGLAFGEGATDGAVPWQAARARQVRLSAQRNEKRNRGAMNLGGDGKLRKEWLAIGAPP
jgi:hypothetical protein